jgi:hypothetical protein
MPISTLYQFSFNGQTFGGTGSPYQILSVDGLEGIPVIRNQDDNRGYNDGMFSGQDFLGGRTISIIMNVFGAGLISAQTNLNTLQQALLPQVTGTTPLYFLLPAPNTEQFIEARVRAFRSTIDPNYTYGFITVQVDFFCPIPIIYDSTLQTASMTLGGALGRVYNRTYNLVYLTGSGPFTTVLNSGWTTTYPTITFNGPITNPVFGNFTQGQYMFFNYTFADVETCVINLLDKTVTLNGLPARNLLTATSDWLTAPPGSNQFYYYGTGTTIVTSATITWRNAYI